MNNKWVRAALVKNLLKTITQHLTIQLRQAETVDAVYNLVLIYMHDHSTGLPRGQVPVKFYLTESNDKDQEEAQKEETEDTTGRSTPHGSPDFNAAPKGGKKGKSKGYGAFLHCGVWGHPRRECSELVGKGSVNAIKGKGKGFKGGKGKGYKGGKGKGYKGSGAYNGGYRSPGKAVGKGFN